MTRRLVFGVGLLGVSCALALFLSARTEAQRIPETGVNGASFGRYQIIINPNVRADTFLVDTQTGRIWTQGQFPELEGEPILWRYQERVDDQAQLAAWLQRQKRKPAR